MIESFKPKKKKQQRRKRFIQVSDLIRPLIKQCELKEDIMDLELKLSQCASNFRMLGHAADRFEERVKITLTKNVKKRIKVDVCIAMLMGRVVRNCKDKRYYVFGFTGRYVVTSELQIITTLRTNTQAYLDYDYKRLDSKEREILLRKLRF